MFGLDGLIKVSEDCFYMRDTHHSLYVPDTWENLHEFATWWVDSGMPIVFPKNPEVFVTDDATAICVFRKDRWQIELYLIHPQSIVPFHEHPGVEVVNMSLDSNRGFVLSDILRKGESHGGQSKKEADTTGFPIVAFEHWQDRDPCTVAVMWKGKTVGPKQEALIRRFHPDAYVVDGYADITRKKEE
jgi:hypothetical protein